MTSLGLPRRVAGVLLTLGLCTAPACSKDDSADRALLELRPVVAANPPPCPAKAARKDQLVLPLTADGKVAECLQLAEPIVDAKDVRSATVAETPAKAPALSVVLGGTGSANLDGFAQRNQGQRLAIVTDGQLVSAPGAASQGGGGPSTESCGPHRPMLPVATRLQAPPSAK